VPGHLAAHAPPRRHTAPALAGGPPPSRPPAPSQARPVSTAATAGQTGHLKAGDLLAVALKAAEAGADVR
jgi:hypothetical protein